jgi:hypothetical protein
MPQIGSPESRHFLKIDMSGGALAGSGHWHVRSQGAVRPLFGRVKPLSVDEYESTPLHTTESDVPLQF